MRRELARARGREVHTTGDGFLATFDGPARAIRCALDLREAIAELGIELRAGLHTGEVEIGRETQVSGAAVDRCIALAASAPPDEVLVTSTVKDLVAGSGIAFADRGEHVLKGIPDQWRIDAVNAE